MSELRLERDMRLGSNELESLHVVRAGIPTDIRFDDGSRAVPVKTTRSFGDPRTPEMKAIHRLGIGVLNGLGREFAEESQELFEHYTKSVEKYEGTWQVPTEYSLSVHRRGVYGDLRPSMDEYARGMNQALNQLTDENLYIAAAVVEHGEHDLFGAIDVAVLGDRALMAAQLEGFIVSDDDGRAPLHIEPLVLAPGGVWRTGLLPRNSQLLVRPLFRRER